MIAFACRVLVPLSALSLFSLAAPAQEPPLEPGFEPLFDGQDWSRHFVAKGKAESWKVVDGAIVASAGGDRLMSKTRYGDYLLRLEWKVSKDGNAGVFLRVPSPDDREPWVSGFEVQISNAPRDDAHCTGSLYGVAAVSPRLRETESEDVWHSFELLSLGPRVRVRADNRVVVDASADAIPEMRKRPRAGHIGLQDYHAANGGTIAYRRIRLARLNAEGLHPGFELLSGSAAGFAKISTGHGSGGSWSWKDGVWDGEQDPPGSGNGGVLASERRVGDFEVAVEIKPDWGVDSGFFLRSSDQGACYQIMIDYHGGDGNVGGIYGEGTGGFNNRNYKLRPGKVIEALPEAKGILPLPFSAAEWARRWDPEGWNELRARVAGNPPRIDVWLNGVHLTSFQDSEKRLPDEGRLGLQVHGGKGWPLGAHTRFRNLQVRPLK